MSWGLADAYKPTIERPTCSFLQNYLVTAPFLVLPPGPPGDGWRLPETISKKDSYPIRDALTSAHLRTYVDEWLNTARRPNGCESPKNRTLYGAVCAFSAVEKFLKDNPTSCSAVLTSSGFDLVIAQPQ